MLQNSLRLWAQHREFRAVYAKLARQPDRVLREMGIDRGDIARLAYAEAERRILTPAPRQAETPAWVWSNPTLAPSR